MELSKARISKYSLLRHKKYRDKENLFMVQGEKAITDTINSFEVEALLIKKGTTVPEKFKNYQYFEISERDLRKISTLESVPNVIGIYQMRQKIQTVEIDKESFSLYLDGIQDPGNFGTIIRTAHWFGIKNIFCSPDTVDFYNPKVVQSTMGSIAKIEIRYIEINQLKDSYPDIPVYGMIMEGENIFAVNNVRPGIIVMGSEGHGPSLNTLNALTRGFTIPPKNASDKPDSLNVAIATAIALSQLVK